ncbi:MAG: hypothetical protein WCL53_03630 [Chloroflexota bacterium]
MHTARRFVASPRGIEAWLIGALTLAVLYPLAQPGYLLLLDLPFGPRPFPVWTFDGTPQHLAPLWLLCDALYRLLPAPEVGGKLFAISVLVAIGMAAAPLGGTSRTGRLFTISLCMVNPWVSDRLAVGQLPLLASYAAAMLAFQAAIRVVQQPSRRSAVQLAAAAAVTGAFSPHLLYVLALVCLLLGATSLVWTRRVSWRALIEAGCIAAVLTMLLSAYWLVPFLAQPSLLGRFGEADMQAFMTRGDPALGVPFNVAAFYGFWRRAVLTKDWLPAWWLFADALLLLSVGGLTAFWRQRSTRSLSLGLLATYAAVLLVACGVAFEPTAGAWRWAFEHVPGFAGLREPQKASAFLVIITAYAGARGLTWLRAVVRPRLRPAVVTLALVLPLVAGAGEFGGVGGALEPVRYPAAWYSAAAFLRANGQPSDAVLVLPWRQYSAFEFTRGATVSNPAPSFLPGTIVSSDDPQLAGLAPPSADERHRVLNMLFTRPNAHDELGSTMGTLSIRWVFVSETSALWEHMPGLEVAGQWDDVTIYEAIGAIAPAIESAPGGMQRLSQVAGIGVSAAALIVILARASARRLRALVQHEQNPRRASPRSERV